MDPRPCTPHLPCHPLDHGDGSTLYEHERERRRGATPEPSPAGLRGDQVMPGLLAPSPRHAPPRPSSILGIPGERYQRTPTPGTTRHDAPVPSRYTANPTPGSAPSHGTCVNGSEYGDSKAFQPRCPEHVHSDRYSNRHRIPQNSENEQGYIDGLCYTFEEPPLPDGWVAYEHPEGHLYFHHKERRLYTDVWMYDSDKFNRVKTFAENVENYILGKKRPLPSDTEIVLTIDDDIGHGYYLVSAKSRGVFWLDPVDAALLSHNLRPVAKKSHLRHASEAQYWFVKSPMIHTFMFPCDRNVTSELLDEVMDLLRFLKTDVMTSDTSTSPYDKDELKDMMDTFADAKPGPREGLFCAIARLMYFFTYTRFINCHGQQCARLQSDMSIYEETGECKRSWLFAATSPLLFYTPDRYIERLERIWVDHTVIHKEWSGFMSAVQKDWEGTVTPATVLLTANVGLLAIQTIDTGHKARSFCQVASYISTFFSLGSIMVCSILSRQHGSARNTAEDAANYLAKKNQRPLGLEALAFTFSLPNAFFVWGIIPFYAAVSWVCLHDTSSITASVSGIVLGVIILVLSIVVCLDWREGPREHSLWLRCYDMLQSQRLRQDLTPAAVGKWWRRSSRSTLFRKDSGPATALTSTSRSRTPGLNGTSASATAVQHHLPPPCTTPNLH